MADRRTPMECHWADPWEDLMISVVFRLASTTDKFFDGLDIGSIHTINDQVELNGDIIRAMSCH